MKLNMERIQELIAERKAVSIPWFQQELEISYAQARELVEKLIQWGWKTSPGAWNLPFGRSGWSPGG